MGIIDFFKNRAGRTEKVRQSPNLNIVPGAFTGPDYLGKAASAGHMARKAIKAKDFDTAWRLLHEQKDLYLQHAKRCRFTKQQALALDATVHEHMANILRQEGKHRQAFTNVLYWVIAQSDRPIKRHELKLGAYYRRCRFEAVEWSEVQGFAQSRIKNPDYRAAEVKVAEWGNRD